MTSNTALWNRIACFTPDDPNADFRFTDRLARENGWTRAFAARAVEEYKRFVYLATIGPREVTPSDVVDQVWHLHLTFTRSYWDDMCGEVLGRKLHHGPTKGGRAEAARYREQYAATLALYAQEFGEAAPSAFWPEARARFTSLVHHAWVDRRSHWVVAKPDWRRWVAALGALVASAGVAAAAEGETNGDTSTLVIGGVVAVSLVLFAVMMLGRGRRGARSKGDNSDTGYVVGTGFGSGGGGKSGKDGGEGGEGGGDGGGGDGGGGCGGGGCGS